MEQSVPLTEKRKKMDINVIKVIDTEITGKTLYYCEDGCNVTTSPDWTRQQCKENTTKECMVVFHNEHCICNR